VDLSQ
jgi:hypothetical protein